MKKIKKLKLIDLGSSSDEDDDDDNIKANNLGGGGDLSKKLNDLDKQLKVSILSSLL